MKYFVAAFLFSTSVMSQTQVWDLDVSHSSINFAVDHMVVSETTGKFDKFTLDVKSDKEDFSDATFNAVIQADSINTADAKRDEHLKNEDFFDVKKYPTISFTGKKFEKVKGNKYKVHGTLDLHGVKKEVVWDAKFNGTIKDPWGNTRAGLKISTTLDRYAYNLKYNSVIDKGGLAVGQEVTINANIELIKKK